MKFFINFFKELANKPEKIRRNWLWFFTILVMTIVLIIWFFSFKNSLKPPALKTLEVEEKVSFWEIFQLGLANFYQGTLKPFAEFFVEKLVVLFSWFLSLLR
mgnify:CR=1 FL=1